VELMHQPRIAWPGFRRVLREHGSPVLPEAEPCYHLCVEQGIDPAFALAMLAVLSDYGSEEGARRCRNWALQDYPFQPLRAPTRSRVHDLAIYPTWLESLRDFLAYMQHKWRDERLTLESIATEYEPLVVRGALDRMRSLIAQWEQMEC
jgi:hypothetical protein